MNIEIKEGIPVPPMVRKAKNSPFQPAYDAMAKMKAGQYFELTVNPDAPENLGKKNPEGNLRYNLQKFARTLMGKFTVRELGGKVGVWCLVSPLADDAVVDAPEN